MFKILGMKEFEKLREQVLKLEDDKSTALFEIGYLRSEIEKKEKKIREDLIRKEGYDAVEDEKRSVERTRAIIEEGARDLEKDKALHEQAKEMSAALAKAELDMKVAQAKLEAYEKMDAKTDRNKIVEYLGDAIKGLSNKSDIYVNDSD